ncbi:MAG: LysR family transcriptional regulator [Acidobacteriota bacterium]
MSRPLDRLTLLQTFVRIADAGSISAAARDLGLSQPSASRQLAELETRLKSQLVRRTTHSLALTAAGTELLADARRLLDEWESIEEKHLAAEDTLQGRLSVVAPVALGQLHLARIAAEFQLEYPRVSLSWQLEDRPIRFAEVGCDCWIKVGSVPDESLVVKRLGRVERLVVAAPRALEGAAVPETPRDAGTRPWLALGPFEGGRLPLQHQDGSRVTLRPPVRMTTNNIFALREATLMGLGLAVLPRWFIDGELESGQLIDVLPQWRAPSLLVHLAFLPGRHQPRRLRIFLDMMLEAIPKIPGIERPD